MWCMMGRLATGAIGLGKSDVSGRKTRAFATGHDDGLQHPTPPASIQNSKFKSNGPGADPRSHAEPEFRNLKLEF